MDTAPFLSTNDPSELLRHTDLVLVVVRSGKTTAEAAHRLAEVLQRFSAPVLGVVFNASERVELGTVIGQLSALKNDWETNHADMIA